MVPTLKREAFAYFRPRPTVEAGSKRKTGRKESEFTSHPGQQIEMGRDDSTILALRVADLDESKRWLIEFRATAEVLESPGLSDKLAGECASTPVTTPWLQKRPSCLSLGEAARARRRRGRLSLEETLSEAPNKAN
jgi:hypothetical protein